MSGKATRRYKLGVRAGRGCVAEGQTRSYRDASATNTPLHRARSCPLARSSPYARTAPTTGRAGGAAITTATATATETVACKPRPPLRRRPQPDVVRLQPRRGGPGRRPPCASKLHSPGPRHPAPGPTPARTYSRCDDAATRYCVEHLRKSVAEKTEPRGKVIFAVCDIFNSGQAGQAVVGVLNQVCP